MSIKTERREALGLLYTSPPALVQRHATPLSIDARVSITGARTDGIEGNILTISWIQQRANVRDWSSQHQCDIILSDRYSIVDVISSQRSFLVLDTLYCKASSNMVF